MDLAPLLVDAERAKAGVEEYRQSLKQERRAEDVAILAAYRAAKKGLPLISLPAAVTAGGFSNEGLPRIAICRTGAQSCWVRWDPWGGSQLLFTGAENSWGRGGLVGKHHVAVSVTEIPTVRHVFRGQTVVPIVPPRHRLRGWEKMHILWEVEAWDPTPPRDPALLRHVRGDLWAVMAVWDLTDVERLVLTQRTRP